MENPWKILWTVKGDTDSTTGRKAIAGWMSQVQHLGLKYPCQTLGVGDVKSLSPSPSEGFIVPVNGMFTICPKLWNSVNFFGMVLVSKLVPKHGLGIRKE